MKTLVAAFITALLVFTLATVWIDMVEPRLAAMQAGAASLARAAREADRRTRHSQGDDDAVDEEEGLTDGDVVASKSKKKSRSKAKKTTEKKDRLLAQLEQVRDEEAKLFERQQTMKMLYEDIFKVLAEEQEARRRSASELAMVEQRAVNSPTNIVNATPVSTGGDGPPSQAIVRKATAEARIADMVQNLADRGSSSAAAVLLSGLREREAAKVLSLLNQRNPKLAVRLSNQVQAARQVANQRF